MSEPAEARNGHLFFVLENVLGPILLPKLLEPCFLSQKNFLWAPYPKTTE
jgi:hypothetical protein